MSATAKLAFRARGLSTGVRLRLSETIRSEWETRSIGGVIPALDGYSGEAEIVVDHATLDAIKADCRFYLDPKAVDATAGERSAYRALLRQIEGAQS